MYQFNESEHDLNGYISTVIRTMITPAPSGPTLQNLVTLVRTAAYVGEPNLPFTPQSVAAAVNSVALSQGLTTRDALIEGLRTQVDDLVARVEALEA